MNTAPDSLLQLFQQRFGNPPDTIIPLPQSGSSRQYFRLQLEQESAIGAYNSNALENQAYIGMTKHFEQYDIPVPKVFGQNKEQHVYLVQDLGDASLLNLLQATRKEGTIDPTVIEYYKQALEQLARLQIVAGNTLDDQLCWERKQFDKQSMLWDLNYFKYYFLKIKSTGFSDQALEDDFHRLADYLVKADSGFFMFRDFQARNIMIHNGQPWFIDFQGGRRGALPYDVISLLFQAKANLPNPLRAELLNHYLSVAGQLTSINEPDFRAHYSGFQLIRFLQVLGAYGFRGLIEGKAHFIESIPFALANLRWWLANNSLPIQLPELSKAVKELTN